MSQEGVMTKETKIGLLVGLAFIIVVGILLSDHVANSSREPQAVLTNVGNNVRDSVAIPSPNPISAPVAIAGPTSPVPTPEELKRQPIQSANVIVGIGPGGSVRSLTEAAATPTEPINMGGQTTMPLAATDEQPVPSDQSNAAPAPATEQQPQTPALPQTASAKENDSKVLKQYKAESGDTIRKIAHKFYGNSSHASVLAILDANPQLKGNAARLQAGRTYAIPALDHHSDVSAADGKTEAVKPASHQKATVAEKTRRSPGGTYTIKAGDTLWKIAAEKLGSGSEWKQIQKLNADVLKGGVLRAGAVLKLPARTVASAD